MTVAIRCNAAGELEVVELNHDLEADNNPTKKKPNLIFDNGRTIIFESGKTGFSMTNYFPKRTTLTNCLTKRTLMGALSLIFLISAGMAVSSVDFAAKRANDAVVASFTGEDSTAQNPTEPYLDDSTSSGESSVPNASPESPNEEGPSLSFPPTTLPTLNPSPNEDESFPPTTHPTSILTSCAEDFHTIVLRSNNNLRKGEFRLSPNGHYRVGLSSQKGDLVVQHSSNDNDVLWRASIVGGERLILQGDGNLVVRNAENKALWASGTASPNSRLTLDNAGQLAVVSRDNNILWQHSVIDVLIVGAGWSGLAAADALHQDNRSFRVLEARDYVGGRSRTLRNHGLGNTPLEWGSAWVYVGTELQAMVDALNLKYGISPWQYDESMGVYQEGTGELEDASKLFADTWSNGFLPYSYAQADALWATNGDEVYEDVVSDYLDAPDSSLSSTEREFIRSELNMEIVTSDAADLDELSAKNHGYELGEGGEMSYLAIPGGGYDLLLSALSAPFQDKIQVDARVTRIEYSTSAFAKVRYFDNRNACQEVTARTVLVTVPLGVLKSSDIEFIPPLPQSKVNAIQNIGFGTLDKCIMYWDDDDAISWWPDDKKVWLQLLTEEDEGVWTMFFNTRSQGHDKYILVGWIGGSAAVDMERQTNDVILSKVLKNLKKMFGNDVVEPSSFWVSRWQQDEYSRGSYSVNEFGTRGSSRRSLRAPVGNLFWAGEATEIEWFATTEGAYRSGRRAAGAISEYLK